MKLTQSQVESLKQDPFRMFSFFVGYRFKHFIMDDSIESERSNIMLTRVAIVENVKSEDGKSSTPVVLVPAEDVLFADSGSLREMMLVKYAKKLEGKNLNTIRVVRSDFTSTG